jgi:acyl-coenzyme A synthetase/AMP-(fatty) acid ligase
LNGATTVIFEGVPIQISVAFGRPSKHKVTQFYTAPTAIRAGKESIEYVQRYQLTSLKVIGSVGEPNEEAWHWYNNHVGEMSCRGYVVANGRNYDFANCFVNLQNLRMLLYHYREFKPFDG